MPLITSLAPGTHFKHIGVTYRLIRVAGTCEQPNRNQWGRATGGTHTADKIAIQVWRYHRGWSPVHYTAFTPGSTVIVVNDPAV